MTEVTIRAADGGSFMGYLALPSAGKGPGVVVIQEIFGVNAVMRAITDGLAGQGYVALCPDLVWRQQPGIQITDKTEAEWARAFELYKGFNEAKGDDRAPARRQALHRQDRHRGLLPRRQARLSDRDPDRRRLCRGILRRRHR